MPSISARTVVSILHGAVCEESDDFDASQRNSPVIHYLAFDGSTIVEDDVEPGRPLSDSEGLHGLPGTADRAHFHLVESLLDPFDQETPVRSGEDALPDGYGRDVEHGLRFRAQLERGAKEDASAG